MESELETRSCSGLDDSPLIADTAEKWDICMLADSVKVVLGLDDVVVDATSVVIVTSIVNTLAGSVKDMLRLKSVASADVLDAKLEISNKSVLVASLTMVEEIAGPLEIILVVNAILVAKDIRLIIADDCCNILVDNANEDDVVNAESETKLAGICGMSNPNRLRVSFGALRHSRVRKCTRGRYA